MISPMTPPGTEIVCINDSVDDFIMIPAGGDLDGLTKGQIYTVKEIIPIVGTFYKTEFGVVLNEITRKMPNEGYAIERFRYLDLAGLDELLKVEVKEKV